MNQTSATAPAYLTVASVSNLIEVVNAITAGVHASNKWTTSLGQCDDDGNSEIVVSYPVAHRDTGEAILIQQSVYVFLPSIVTEILQRVYDCIDDIMQHELRECFLYRGERIYDPHSI